MKRKLDANDVPSAEVAEEKETKEADNTDFESLNLDPRLRQALIKEQFTKPTPVQAKAIPLALEGKDILGKHRLQYVLWLETLMKSARAKTGSGKTAAYILPILQTILQKKAVRYPYAYLKKTKC
jgi:ATP-dependent RNA helicase DDX56/DBP9